MRLGLKRDEVRLVKYTEEWQHEFQKVKQEGGDNFKPLPICMYNTVPELVQIQVISRNGLFNGIMV